MKNKTRSFSGAWAVLAAKRAFVAILLSSASTLLIPACTLDTTGVDHDKSCGSSCDAEAKEEPSEEAPESAGEKVYPPPSGEHVSEAAACEALVQGQTDIGFSLECVVTTKTCPDLLRKMTGLKCAEYDNGSVQGCIERYKAESTCQGLTEAIEACVVTAYPGPEPAGCS